MVKGGWIIYTLISFVVSGGWYILVHFLLLGGS